MIGSFFVTNGITIICLVYMILILLMYYIKGKINTISSKVFFGLLLATIVTMFAYIEWGTLAVNRFSQINLMGKVISFITVCWNIILVFYISIIFKTDEENNEFYKKHKTISYVLGIILVLVNLFFVIILDFQTIKVDHRLYALGGILTTYEGMTGALAVIYAVVTLIINRKKLDNITKILGLFVIIICSISISKFISGNTQINDTCFLHAIVVMFLYLSLESQDKALVTTYKESSQKAKESNELKTEFIMNMSHQLRTPMNTILGFSDLLLNTEHMVQSELIEDAMNIEQAAKNLLDMINSILDISRIESKKVVVNNENYTLESVIFDISSHINPQIKKEKVVFTINVEENCPNDLYGDASKLTKVLNVILSNAVNNTTYGEVNFNVSSKSLGSEKHELIFHIKNSGHTMKKESFDRNFDDLIKINTEGNNDVDADTLKIVAAKELLNLIGGKIEFINKEGQGTQYIIKIQQKITTQKVIGNIKDKIQTTEEFIKNHVDLSNKRILIVDDKKVNSVILDRLLTQYNAIIEETPYPSIGIEKAINKKYDVIFINHELEDMSGEDFIKQLVAVGNNIPPAIGLLTGTEDLTKIKSYTYTLDCPIEYRQLNKVLRKIFDKES